MTRVMFANILLDPNKIGTRILDFNVLNELTRDALGSTIDVDREVGAAEGHIILDLKGSFLGRAKEIISCGDGQHTNNPDDYVIRKHWSGGIMTCLKRQFAAPAKTVKLIIQTKDAYLRDPDMLVAKDSIYVKKEKERLTKENPTHVVVWVVASAASGTMPMGTLVRNLSGFNEDAKLWDGDEIRRRIKEAYDADKSWCVVSD